MEKFNHKTDLLTTRQFSFEISARSGRARRGVVHTAHGDIQTPAFMPVGTAATVKAMLPESVAATGAEILLGNTYHLMLRPGAERIRQLGGLHKFMNWNKPILTDSGGFQVMSLSEIRKITDKGVEFQSHIDGSKHMLTPERSMEIQHLLGSDITMIFDECTPYPATYEETRNSMRLSLGWAERSKKRFMELKNRSPLKGNPDDLLPPGGGVDEGKSPQADVARIVGGSSGESGVDGTPPHDSAALSSRAGFVCSPSRGEREDGYALFGIQQGGMYEDLREESSKVLNDMDFEGMAIGGLAVGEGQEKMFEVLDYSTDMLPDEKPRYLMGVGFPEDIIGAVLRGVDMFDCVLPTRSGRTGQAFTHEGRLNIKNAKHADDPAPLDSKCGCPTCSDYSRAYLHHLIKSGEILGAMLLTWHNLHYYQDLMSDIRQAIEDDRFAEFVKGYFP